MTNIYMLPYAGGGASSYRSYGERFPGSNGAIIPVEIPGRGKRSQEPFATSFEDCVTRSSDQLSDTADEYIVHGHCMGALLAFEMIKLLERQGRALPRFLVVSGRNAPHYKNEWALRVAGLDDRAFFSELQAIGGVPKGLNFAMAQDFLAVIRSDQRMGRTYEPGGQLIGLPILVLGGELDEMTNAAALQEWQDYTSGRVEVRWLAGEHYFILDQPDQVADCMSEFSASVSAKHASVR